MKKYLTLVAALSVVMCGALAAPAQGQTLAEAAKREAERRAKLQQEAVKTYTSADVEARPGSAARVETVPAPLAAPEAGAPEAKPAAAAAAEAKGAKADPAKIRLKRDEEHWRERAEAIRARLNKLRGDTAALEGRLAELQAERENASGARATALNGEIQEASTALTRYQRDVRLIDEEWNKFEARARDAKIPLSWIR